jgi:hypothetical protein
VAHIHLYSVSIDVSEIYAILPLHLVAYLSCLVTDLFKPFLVGILLVDSEVGSFSRKFLQRLHPLEWLDNYLGDCKLNCLVQG